MTVRLVATPSGPASAHLHHPPNFFYKFTGQMPFLLPNQQCQCTESMYRHSKKNLLSSNTSSTCPYSMANFSPLTAEIGSGVCGTPANLNGFASCLHYNLQQRASGLVHYIYIFWGSCPWRNFARWKIHVMSKSCILWYWQRYCMALQQQASAKLCGMVQGMELRNFCRGRHLYPAGQPSRWASARILVLSFLASPIVRGCRLDVYYTSTHDVAWVRI